MTAPTAEEFHTWVDRELLLPVLLAAHGHRQPWQVTSLCTDEMALALSGRQGRTRGLPTSVRTWLCRRPSSLEVSGTLRFTNRRHEPFGARIVPSRGRLLVDELETVRFRHVRPRAPEPPLVNKRERQRTR